MPGTAGTATLDPQQLDLLLTGSHVSGWMTWEEALQDLALRFPGSSPKMWYHRMRKRWRQGDKWLVARRRIIVSKAIVDALVAGGESRRSAFIPPDWDLVGTLIEAASKREPGTAWTLPELEAEIRSLRPGMGTVGGRKISQCIQMKESAFYARGVNAWLHKGHPYTVTFTPVAAEQATACACGHGLDTDRDGNCPACAGAATTPAPSADTVGDRGADTSTVIPSMPEPSECPEWLQQRLDRGIAALDRIASALERIAGQPLELVLVAQRGPQPD